MIAITAMSAIQTGEGSRIVVTYSEVGDDGEFVRQNVKKNYIATARRHARGHRDAESRRDAAH